jgi:hypothetical protein
MRQGNIFPIQAFLPSLALEVHSNRYLFSCGYTHVRVMHEDGSAD